jgi:hypothetical protein
MPRSGTTLIEQILANHPRIFGAGELPYMGEIVTTMQQRFNTEKAYPQLVQDLDAKNMDILAGEYLDRLSSHSAEALRITDKMPHNFLQLGLIDCMLPGARIIHCQRDPLDTCLSIYFHNFNANHPYASNLQQLGTYYRLYQDLMQHWKSVLRIPILDISMRTWLPTRIRQPTMIDSAVWNGITAACDIMSPEEWSARPAITRSVNPYIQNPSTAGRNTRGISSL